MASPSRYCRDCADGPKEPFKPAIYLIPHKRRLVNLSARRVWATRKDSNSRDLAYRFRVGHDPGAIR